MRIGQNVGDADHAHPKPELGEDLSPLAVVPIGERGAPSHHEPVERLREEKAEPGLGRDVFHEKHPPRLEEPREALENPPLVGSRKMVHHVEHVSRVERAFEGCIADVPLDEAMPSQPQLLAQSSREPNAPGARIDSHDLSPRLSLTEVSGEEPKAAPDVENATLL